MKAGEIIKALVPAAVGLVTAIVDRVRGKASSARPHRDIQDTSAEIAERRAARDRRMRERVKDGGE